MRILAPAVLAVALLSAGALCAEDSAGADAERAIAAALQDHPMICGTPDLSRAAADVWRWLEPTFVRGLAEKDRSKGLEVLKAVEGNARGPAVVFSADGKSFLLIARVALPEEELRQAVATHPELTEKDGLVVVGSPDAPMGYLALRDGNLFASTSAETLLAALGSAAPTQAGYPFPAKIAALLDLQQAGSCSFFVFHKSAQGRPPNAEEPGRAPFQRVQQRLKEAVCAQVPTGDWDACWVTLGERSLYVRGWEHLPGPEAPPIAGPDTLLGPIRLPRRYAAEFCVTGRDMSVLAEQWELLMEALDPDAAAEFREELGELDRDLGYSFRRDFLPNLGPAWTVGIPPDDGTGRVGLAFASHLVNTERFVEHARRLAELGAEPWAAGEPQGGVVRFTTGAFTLPLELAVSDNTMVLAPDKELLEEALASATEKELPKADDKTPASGHGSPELRLTVRWQGVASLLSKDGDFGAFREAWAQMPADARCVLAIRRSGSSLHMDLQLRETGPDDLARWIEPLFKHLQSLAEPFLTAH